MDRAVVNVLTSKFAAGLFDVPYTEPQRVATLDSPADRRLAREAAEQSIILLQVRYATGARDGQSHRHQATR